MRGLTCTGNDQRLLVGRLHGRGYERMQASA